MSDIDLLVVGDEAGTLHRALCTTLGYAPDEPGTPERHLPALSRRSGLPVEIHHHLSDGGAEFLERRVWSGSRSAAIAASIEIPDATALMMHALDHAVVVHRTARFRLRDVIDVSLLMTDAVDRAELHRFVEAHPDARAMRTLLLAASDVAPSGAKWAEAGVESRRASHRAWQRIRRVGRTRLLAPVRDGIPPAADPRVVVLSQLAQGSPGGIVRLAARAIAMPGRAMRLLSGEWLPAEARATDVEGDRTVSAPGR